MSLKVRIAATGSNYNADDNQSYLNHVSTMKCIIRYLVLLLQIVSCVTRVENNRRRHLLKS